MISGKKAVIIDINGLKQLDYPVFEGKIIKFDSKDWIDWDHFNVVFGKVRLSEIYNKIREKISLWNWAEHSMSDYATAFVFLSVFQHAIAWRPWLHLTGARGTGKSSFFDYIMQPILGVLTQRLDKSTAHAIAQSVGNTTKIPILDNLKKISISLRFWRWLN